MQTPMTDLLSQYMDANRGWVSEADLISSIALLAGNGEHRHPRVVKKLIRTDVSTS